MKMTVERFRYTNRSSREIAVWIEPWGEKYAVGPNQSIVIVFYGLEIPHDDIEIIAGESGEVWIYGRAETEVFVLRENVCVSQPAIREIVLRAAEKYSVSAEEVERIIWNEKVSFDFSQHFLDSAPEWNADGEKSSILVAEKIGTILLSELKNRDLVWEFCLEVLHLRGIFPETKDNLLKENVSPDREDEINLRQILKNRKSDPGQHPVEDSPGRSASS